MVHTFQGNKTAAEGRFAIVVSRFNESITGRLLDGAVQTLDPSDPSTAELEALAAGVRDSLTGGA